MSDESFQKPMLYYPQQWALRLLPLGVPAGVMGVENSELNGWIFSSAGHCDHVPFCEGVYSIFIVTTCDRNILSVFEISRS